MGTPNSVSIVNDIVSTLAAITVAGGYKTTVEGVVRYGRNPDEATKRPCLDVHKGPVDYVYVQSGPTVQCNMTVTIIGHVAAATPALKDVAVENLLDDCIAALNADPTLGGNATDMKLVRSEDDVSDHPQLRNSQGLGADFALQVKVQWYRSTGAS